MGCAERRRLQRAFLWAPFFWPRRVYGNFDLYRSGPATFCCAANESRTSNTRKHKDRQSARDVASRGDASSGTCFKRSSRKLTWLERLSLRGLTSEKKCLGKRSLPANLKRAKVLEPCALGYLGLLFDPQAKFVQVVERDQAVEHPLYEMVPNG